MRYQSARAFRRALEDRLKSQAGQSNVRLAKLRKLVTFDRLLARLIAVSPERWVLKGALALDLRFHGEFRTTKDLDLGRYDGEAAATQDFLHAQSLNIGDYFAFAIEKVAEMGVEQEWAATRYSAEARLDERRFERVQIDVGFSEGTVESAVLIPGTELLEFAGIPPIAVPTLPLVEHIAEKVHAYTRIYSGHRVSTRVKDLVDLVVIASRAELPAEDLRDALQYVFTSRYMHTLPERIPEPPDQWVVPYRRMANEVGISPDLTAGFNAATTFLNPLLAGNLPDNARWDPTTGSWYIPTA